ncbi:hypothetical protein [Microbispora triticiradicis]|uniref:hypothetical protein n=1 Tax=Microbispora triticiradicis TaxID=2200763 RepID=UPI001AD60DE4|nr:hypothetical protein [Microbispora triticiradicis]MBO4271331.1 hypothetical protein [Microbispora triticiradicis]
MSHTTRQPSQQTMAAILACGMSTAVELVAARGLDHALTAVGSTVQETLSAEEMGILASAVALILAQREAAPADLSALPDTEMPGCSDAGCLICWGAVS